MPTEQYAYRTLHWNGRHVCAIDDGPHRIDTRCLPAVLSEQGRLGWELVGILPTDGGSQLVFKRALVEQKPRQVGRVSETRQSPTLF